MKKINKTHIYQFWAWILLVWCLYRYYFSFPEPVDEFIVKPLVFVVPVLLYLFFHEHQPLASIGITKRSWVKNILVGLGIGSTILFVGAGANVIKYGTLSIATGGVVKQYGLIMVFLLSLATAFSEELLTRGFLFSRLWKAMKNVWLAALIATLLFLSFHIPVLVTSLKFQGMTLIIFFWMNFILGFANSTLYAYTGSLISPIFVHLFWNLTVAMFL